MPWIEATLRGQRVLARAKGDGTLVDEGGRVEIRYKPTDGKSYRAGLRNLEVATGAKLHPDETCAPVAAGAPSGGASRTAKSPAPHAVPADAWIAYTDGACSGNPGPAGSGVVLVAPGGKMHEGLEYLGQATNNVAELTAILRAVEWIPADAKAIVVHTDSQYAIGVLQKGWKAKANGELVAQAKRVVAERGAKLVYVPGHQGVALNERADELAREAVTSRSSRAVRFP
ncbi:MAG: ribonuclease H [Polyangiaceae bacterium]|jgi:ribonuclease HI